MAAIGNAVREGGVVDPSRQRLAVYLREWIETVVREQNSDSLRVNYDGLVRNWLTPSIGGRPLASLTAQDIELCIAEMARAGTSGRLRQVTYHMLNRSLKRAARLGLIRSNPVTSADRPSAPKTRVQYLIPEQLGVLLETAKDTPFEALIVLAATTGARLDELLGLLWGDLTLRRGAGRMELSRTLKEDSKGKLELVDGLKAECTGRAVDLGDRTVEALLQHRARLGALPLPDAVVFTSRAGGPVRRSNFHRGHWHPLLERAGLPRIRFHDLRHTHATALLAQGVHPKVVQERLGHSRISLTLDTYSHLLPTMQRDAAEVMDELLA